MYRWNIFTRKFDLIGTGGSGGGGITWNTITGTTVQTSVENGYIVDNTVEVTLTLPTEATVGQKICFLQKGTGNIKIAQNSGQTIHTISSDTTTGITGDLQTVDQWTSFCLICVTEDIDFAVMQGSHGSLFTT